MAKEAGKLSIDELRRRFVSGDEVATARLLGKLKRDPRDGVRKIYVQLKQRAERDRLERVRLDAMLNFERVLWRSGVRAIAGVDEVGVGPLAGPVVAAAVVFAPGTELRGVDDSKKLDREQRTSMDAAIRRVAVAIGIGQADVAEIDTINIYHAALLAMRRAVEALSVPPEHVLVDARTIPELVVPQNAFSKGDGINFSIAAASIIAKVHRDALMEELDARYPGYGFARHVGYGTAEHHQAIRRLGTCPIHRSSFPAIREICGELSPLFYELKRALESSESRESLAAAEKKIEARRAELADQEQQRLRLVVTRRWATL